MLLIQHKASKQNWVTNVKAVLLENGFGIVWLCQSVGYETHFITEFKDRLVCCTRKSGTARWKVKKKKRKKEVNKQTKVL